ncbi:hypothetical protein TorRG33x02_185710 [Trema orientale]|uniref:Uncharacterized protein n=1 Tax=Trema orientale TaxID=63057 RepID=A0A2P5EJ45_TREOI|nr:hypothetical protein TorRG33x02_185710 [Trema orientale]
MEKRYQKLYCHQHVCRLSCHLGSQKQARATDFGSESGSVRSTASLLSFLCACGHGWINFNSGRRDTYAMLTSNASFYCRTSMDMLLCLFIH